jgi:hypothetical protein
MNVGWKLLRIPIVNGDRQSCSFETLIEEQHQLFKKNSKTIFIAAHFGWYPKPRKLGELLDELPNVVVEFGAVIAELGRQPDGETIFYEIPG